MTLFNPNDHPHRRWNPLLEEWVLVSPHRAKRPWSGAVEPVQQINLPAYDAGCYLCPGNARANGKMNPQYKSTHVFDNDFAALLPEVLNEDSDTQCNGLIRAKPEAGLCRVVCFSPHHNVTLAEIKIEDIRHVIDIWCTQYQEIAALDQISSVTIFENRGEIMGCSNPHPHGQIWANQSIPNIQQKELETQTRYYKQHKSALLYDYLQWERKEAKRIVTENSHFTVLVPHWAVWPFEILLLPNRSVSSITELDNSEKDSWAEIMQQILIRYDNVFETSFSYSMGIHQQPTDGKPYAGMMFHQHYYPPLLRSAAIKKFQVGYEMSAEPQRDITPEQAASKLRECSSTHYKRQ